MARDMPDPDEPTVVMEYIGHNHKRPNLRRLIARQTDEGDIEFVEQMWNGAENGWENLGLVVRVETDDWDRLTLELGERSRIQES